MDVTIIVLAAGQGKRMRSQLPKVLHQVGGKPLLEHVLITAASLAPEKIVVVHGHGGEAVRTRLEHAHVSWIEQTEQLGTGHAVSTALVQVSDATTVLVLYGDVPLVRPATLQALLQAKPPDGLAVLTTELDDPQGYGRIVRDARGRVTAIIEEADATEEQRRIREVNTGILVAPSLRLRGWLASLNSSNMQGEYYLTDVIARAAAEGCSVKAVKVGNGWEVMGVNDKLQLARVERQYQRLQAEAVMAQGVTICDPARFDLRGELTAGADVVIDVNVIIEGKVTLGDGVRIGPNTIIRNTTISDRVQILANCVIEDAIVGADSRIGPFSRIRPETELADKVHIGNFVEIKKSNVGRGSKINHLSYLGDSSIGANVNIGAGVIVCNYDGAHKHHTSVGDNAFVGSGTQLVAPVNIGAGATIGAGSTITKDVPDGVLALSRSPQRIRPGWKRPTKDAT